jgi:hypothetical protein
MAKENFDPKWERLFPGIKKSVMAARFDVGTTEEYKMRVFCKLVRLLLDRGVIKSDGNAGKWRSGCLKYLTDVIPLLEKEDINLILENEEKFYKKFCFTPSKKVKSLFSEIREKEEAGRFGTIPLVDLYERYRAEMGLSPYELQEQEGAISEFLGTIVDDSGYLFSES